MCQEQTRNTFFKRRVCASRRVLAFSVAFMLAGIPPVYAQTDSGQKFHAVMAAISILLLGECTDSDKDTLCDADEMKYFGDLDEDASGDFEGDGLSNGEELNIYGTNPAKEDTDEDGLEDYAEVYTYRTDPARQDTDKDGLHDGAEVFLGLSPTLTFTDGDTLGSDTPADKAMMHKLNRLTFGPTQIELEQVTAVGGIDDWISDQLIPIGLPPRPPYDAGAVAPVYDSNSMTSTYPLPYDCSIHVTPDPAQAMRDCYVARRNDAADIPGTFRPMHSIKQLQSRMAMFWDNHFNTDMNGHDRRGMQELTDEDNWFVNAFGNFKTLLDLNARNFTMLEYLDLDDNRKYSPNENFPREVMELHSVGIGGGYTALDIAQLAYVLTGWDHQEVRYIDGECSADGEGDVTDVTTCSNVSRYGYRQQAENDNYEEDGGVVIGETGLDESAKYNPLRIFDYREYDHDDGLSDYDDDGVFTTSKTLFLGTAYEKTINSLSGEAGVQEGEEALDFLATHPNTAKFICTKLAQEFISDTPLTATTEDCELVFLANPDADDQMGLVLANLLASAEFNDPTTQRGKLKDTQEAMLSLARLLGWNANHAYPGGEVSYDDSIAYEIRDAEQPVFYKAEPTGYYETAENWLNTNTALKRFKEMNDMMANHDGQSRDFVAYFKTIYGPNPTSVEIMTHLFSLMLGGYYDGYDVQLGVDLLNKDDLEVAVFQPFDIDGSEAEERITALITVLTALSEFQLH